MLNCNQIQYTYVCGDHCLMFGIEGLCCTRSGSFNYRTGVARCNLKAEDEENDSLENIILT